MAQYAPENKPSASSSPDRGVKGIQMTKALVATMRTNNSPFCGWRKIQLLQFFNWVGPGRPIATSSRGVLI